MLSRRISTVLYETTSTDAFSHRIFSMLSLRIFSTHCRSRPLVVFGRLTLSLFFQHGWNKWQWRSSRHRSRQAGTCTDAQGRCDCKLKNDRTNESGFICVVVPVDGRTDCEKLTAKYFEGPRHHVGTTTSRWSTYLEGGGGSSQERLLGSWKPSPYVRDREVVVSWRFGFHRTMRWRKRKFCAHIFRISCICSSCSPFSYRNLTDCTSFTNYRWMS